MPSHHIAVDGWSVGPLTNDLTTAYEARCAGSKPDWEEPLPAQYADYVAWQREFLGDPDDQDSLQARQLRYWTSALAGLPPELELPYDRPRPPVSAHRAGSLHFRLGTAVQGRLVTLAKESRATVFMVLQTAIVTLLSRLGAGTDIPLGSAVAGRSEEEFEDLVGFFVNTVVLRTDLSGDPTFRELCDRVRDIALAALADPDAVLIADETGDIKKGRKSAGVQRQYTGTAGRIENAQVSVYLSYGSRLGRTLIDRELYLGREWAGAGPEHEARCAEQVFPTERARAVLTKPELARPMLERALAAHVPFSCFLADEVFGQSRALRA